MLLQHGIETVSIEKYVPILARNFSRKNYRFGTIKNAVAKDANNKVIYEIIYVEMIDELEQENKSVNSKVEISGNTKEIDASQDKFKVSTDLITIDQLVEKFVYPNSTTAMKQRFAEAYPNNDSSLIQINDSFLPLWMRSIQDATGTSLGYIKAVPIAYVKPGTSISIIDNIKDSGFDFKTIHFDIDRLTIDSVEGQKGDKYIAFPKRKVI